MPDGLGGLSEVNKINHNNNSSQIGTFFGDVAELFGGANENSSAAVANRRQLALQHDSQAFNSAEAQKQRDWEEYMSSSAHQREMADLKAAGLNPILAAESSGAAAPAGSGATSSAGQASRGTGMKDVMSIFSSIFGSVNSSRNANKVNDATIKANESLNKSKAAKFAADAAYMIKLAAKL